MATFLFFRQRNVRGIYYWLVVLDADDKSPAIKQENRLSEIKIQQQRKENDQLK
jgi:hypothetical protein